MVLKAIDPKIWGPSGWHILHRISFAVRSAEEAANFYKSLQLLLPCPNCRNNLKTHFDNLHIPSKASDFGMWVWRLHKRVSKSLGNNNDAPSFAKVREKYMGSSFEIHVSEAIFLMALAETHPGGTCSSEYKKALRDFISVYVASTHNATMPSNKELYSRPGFRKWVQKITGVQKMDFAECHA